MSSVYAGAARAALNSTQATDAGFVRATQIASSQAATSSWDASQFTQIDASQLYTLGASQGNMETPDDASLVAFESGAEQSQMVGRAEDRYILRTYRKARPSRRPRESALSCP